MIFSGGFMPEVNHGLLDEQAIFAQIQNSQPIDAIIKTNQYGNEEEMVFMSSNKELVASLVQVLSESLPAVDEPYEKTFYYVVSYSGGLLNLDRHQQNPAVFLEYVKQDVKNVIIGSIPWRSETHNPIERATAAYAMDAEENGYPFEKNPEIEAAIRTIVVNACKNGVTIGDGAIDRIANAHVDKCADIEQVKMILDQNNIKVNDLLVLEEAITHLRKEKGL